MKKLNVLAVSAMVMVGITFTSCFSKKAVSVKTDYSEDAVSLKTEIDSVSYIIGAIYGQGLREQTKQYPGTPGNMDALIAGFLKAAKGDSIHLGMDMQESQSFANNYFQNAQMRAAEVAKEEADKFLAENKTKSGVITTASGLQYKVITEGTGPKPAYTDTVKIHYHGTLANGEVFQSTVQQGEPAEIPISIVIPGWQEGVQLMPVGSKYIFWISPELGYGMTPPPNSPIKPNSVLVFEVELLEIVKK